MKQNGLTLVELIITISVTAVLLSIALPSYSHLLQKTQLATSTNELYSSLALARAKAVAMKSRVTIRAKGSWQNGWHIFEDPNGNGELDTGEFIIEDHQELTGVTTNSSSTISRYVSYTSHGDSRSASQTNTGSFQAGNIKVCTENRNSGIKLTLSRGGRVRTNNLSSAECSD